MARAERSYGCSPNVSQKPDAVILRCGTSCTSKPDTLRTRRTDAVRSRVCYAIIKLWLHALLGSGRPTARASAAGPAPRHVPAIPHQIVWILPSQDERVPCQGSATRPHSHYRQSLCACPAPGQVRDMSDQPPAFDTFFLSGERLDRLRRALKKECLSISPIPSYARYGTKSGCRSSRRSRNARCSASAASFNMQSHIKVQPRNTDQVPKERIRYNRR